MTMPEASVHENCLFAFSKNYIGFSWQVTSVQPKPIPEPMQNSTNDQFRLGVSSFDSAHSSAAFGRCQTIHFNRRKIANDSISVTQMDTEVQSQRSFR
jgi:hypothetical protein